MKPGVHCPRAWCTPGFTTFAGAGAGSRVVACWTRRARRSAVLLESKNAIVYGAAGAIGGAVARAFARDGARVFLAGRTLATLEEVAADIRGHGGGGAGAQFDAMDKAAVDAHADRVAAAAGRIDVSFNAVSVRAV